MIIKSIETHSNTKNRKHIKTEKKEKLLQNQMNLAYETQTQTQKTRRKKKEKTQEHID